MEQTQLFDLVYAGAVLVGFSEQQVKANFAKHLKLTEEKVDKLFTGKRVTLKKAISKEKAEQWQQKLLKIGAETVLVPALNSALTSSQNSSAKTASLFEESTYNDGPSATGSKASGETKQSVRQNTSPPQNPDLGNSQQEYDEDMQKRIARAQALIAAQQMEQQSGAGKKDDSMKRLWVFSVVLIAAVLLLYFYAESIA